MNARDYDAPYQRGRERGRAEITEAFRDRLAAQAERVRALEEALEPFGELYRSLYMPDRSDGELMQLILDGLVLSDFRNAPHALAKEDAT